MGRAACLFLLSIDAYVNSHRPLELPKQLANHTECNQNQAHAICAESAVLYRSSKTSIYLNEEVEFKIPTTRTRNDCLFCCALLLVRRHSKTIVHFVIKAPNLAQK